MAFFKTKAEVNQKIIQELNDILLPGEEVEMVENLLIDYVAITNKRLIASDKDVSFSNLETVLWSFAWNQIAGVGINTHTKAFKIPSLIIVVGGKTVTLKGTDKETISKVYQAILAKIC